MTTLADILAAVERQREATEANTAAVTALVDAIASRRRRSRATEPAPALPAGHVYAGAATPLSAQTLQAIEVVRERLTYGWAGHAPPRPQPPGFDKPLPRLTLWHKAHELLASMSADEMLTAIDEVAELVEAGVLPASDWTATKVFSGWLPGMRIRHAEWKRDQIAADRRARENERAAGDAPATGAPITPELAEAARRRFASEAST